MWMRAGPTRASWGTPVRSPRSSIVAGRARAADSRVDEHRNASPKSDELQDAQIGEHEAPEHEIMIAGGRVMRRRGLAEAVRDGGRVVVSRSYSSLIRDKRKTS